MANHVADHKTFFYFAFNVNNNTLVGELRMHANNNQLVFIIMIFCIFLKLNLRHNIVLLLLLVACADEVFAVPPQNPAPNIILITADDLGMQLGCYGDTIIDSPHLDRFAKEGIRFTNAYVTQSSCSPSRSSIYTGLYPHQNGQVGLSHRGFTMLDSIPNLVRILKDHGYRTGIIGKLHIQPAEEYPFDFEHTNVHDTRDVKWVSQQASDFIEDGDGPFFLSVNYFDPHTKFLSQVKGIPETPYRAEDVAAFDFQLVDVPPQLERIAGYYSCVKRLDIGIGLLMEMLESKAILENTVIVFVSDHGAPFTRGKTASYESSIKVPMMVRYPDVIKPETTSSALVSTIDILPTLLDLAKLEVPGGIPGHSLLPVFEDPRASVRTLLFAEHNFHIGRGLFPRRTVRDNQFKLIHNINLKGPNKTIEIDKDSAYYYAQQPRYEGTLTRKLFDRLAAPPEFELYDLSNDPHEYWDLSTDPEYKSVMERLKRELYAWRKNTNDPMLYDFFWERFNFNPVK